MKKGELSSIFQTAAPEESPETVPQDAFKAFRYRMRDILAKAAEHAPSGPFGDILRFVGKLSEAFGPFVEPFIAIFSKVASFLPESKVDRIKRETNRIRAMARRLDDPGVNPAERAKKLQELRKQTQALRNEVSDAGDIAPTPEPLFENAPLMTEKFSMVASAEPALKPVEEPAEAVQKHPPVYRPFDLA